MANIESLSSLSDLEVIQHALGLSVSNVNVPSTPLDCVIVVADVESNERNHEQLLEWGQFVIDSSNIDDVHLDQADAELLRCGEARHYRIKENAHITNRRYVQGCPEKYLFGKTEWVSNEELAVMLQELLGQKDSKGNPRLVLFVAHDTNHEVRMLKQVLGDKFAQYQENMRILDTQKMASSLGYGHQVGLQNLLGYLDIPFSNLHNGGNDAFYEAVAAITMAVFSSQLDCRSPTDSASEHTTGNTNSSSEENTSSSSSDDSPGGVSVTTLTTSVSAITTGSMTLTITIDEAIKMKIANAAASPLPATHGSFVYCSRCASAEHSAGECPCKSHQCSNCYSKGHTAKVCGIPEAVVGKVRATNIEKFGAPRKCNGCGELGHAARNCIDSEYILKEPFRRGTYGGAPKPTSHRPRYNGGAAQQQPQGHPTGIVGRGGRVYDTNRVFNVGKTL
ncbi:hypothetical protein NA57DRAFT_80669 [Rhizodiscina lignyota]|uniref:CCHC-type domain-containing protein n=1 Tax=Rhizodiscina lignyota TaxID=1504668 RepID=A0A9P4M239_9PEZI|nr:hypothetical protein NA57DRAFT_80669 [Rhizodiscina lignyota]